MRKATITFLLLVFIVVLVVIYFNQSTSKKTYPSFLPTTNEQIERESEALGMSLDEKIGQLMIVGFENKYIDSHIRKMIKEYHIGGINLLGRNVAGREQVKQLIFDLQELAEIPLFIAADQEGGKFVRFKFLDELISQNQITDRQQAEQVAFRRAQELSELGVNMNFSPVIDYVPDQSSYLYKRTFATSPDITGELGSAMIDGYRRGGIIPVAKHFPGYGNIFPDPHKNQAILSLDEEGFEASLLPFKNVVIRNPDIAIMTAHIVIPLIDTKSATLSSKFLNEILRRRLGFKGVVITDDIEMAAVGSSPEQAAVSAIKAGADIIISTYTPEKQIMIFNALKNSVLEGEIKEERIDESVERILDLKSTLIK